MTERETPQQGGLSRRDMLKRSAVVGGALVWTTPAVQSLAGPAFASEATGTFDKGDKSISFIALVLTRSDGTKIRVKGNANGSDFVWESDPGPDCNGGTCIDDKDNGAPSAEACLCCISDWDDAEPVDGGEEGIQVEFTAFDNGDPTRARVSLAGTGLTFHDGRAKGGRNAPCTAPDGFNPDTIVTF